MLIFFLNIIDSIGEQDFLEAAVNSGSGDKNAERGSFRTFSPLTQMLMMSIITETKKDKKGTQEFLKETGISFKK